MTHLQVRLDNRAPMHLAAEFDCAAGELIALVGPSGSGKTSLLRAVAGLLHAPTLRGWVRVGEETWFDSAQGFSLPPQQRCVGLVFQHYALFPHLSALDNVTLGNCPAGYAERWVARAHALFERLGLRGLESRRPGQLSGGQQQRVALARALMRVATVEARSRRQGCGVLLLDEPFSAVDAPTRQTLYRELAALRRDVSTPMVLVTHDLHEARRLADRVVIVDAGETLQSGPPAKVFSSPRNARVADLVGIQNHFEGRFFKAGAEAGWGRLRWTAGDRALELRVVDKGRLDDGVAVTWVVAGEYVDVRTSPGSMTTAGADNQFECAVLERLALGETSLCVLAPLALPAARLTLNLPSALLRAEDDRPDEAPRLWVRLPAPGIHIMPQRTGG